MYYKKSWATLFLRGASGREIIDGTAADSTAMEKECAACAAARTVRQRVLPYGIVAQTSLREEPFASAPAIFNYNVPKYFAVHLRAREFAKTHKRQISWTIAQDKPLLPDDRMLPEAV